MSVNWLKISQEAINEHSSKKIFAMAFPWLFPGGIGDVKDFAGDMKDWGEMMYRCKDGRFQKSKFFVFYAWNYIVRHRNSRSSNWFLKDFNKDGPENLEELKEAISKGDKSFINRITCFNQKIKGSTPFWHQKRSELYTWINHHIKMGHGAPMLFVTLSCAENYWPDIIQLIKDRLKIAGEDASQCYCGSPKMSKFLNDHSLVVQEYFQERVNVWMETVGKHVLGIEHHWGRYEFAPGRGQIHIHLLGIAKDNSIYKLCHQDLKEKDGEAKRANRLSEWADKKFGLTASVPKGNKGHESNVHPSSVRLSEAGKNDAARPKFN